MTRHSIERHPSTCLLWRLCHVLRVAAVLFAMGNFPSGVYGQENDSQLCTTSECRRIAKLLEDDMNLSADPCEHPRDYFCGGWLSRFDLPPDEKRWGVTFDVLANKSRNAVQDILIGRSCSDIEEDLRSNPNTNYSDWDMVSTCFYEDCMNLETRDNEGAAPLFNAMLRDKSTSMDFLIKTNFTAEADLEFHRKGGILSQRMGVLLDGIGNTPFWSFSVHKNYLLKEGRNAPQTFFLEGDGLGLAYRLYDEKNKDIQLAYKKHIAELFRLFDEALEKHDGDLYREYVANNPNKQLSLEDRAERIYELEFSLRDLMIPPEKARDIEELSFPITYRELCDRSPFLDMSLMFDVLRKHMPRETNFSDGMEMIITDLEYFRKLGDFLHSHNWEAIHDYMLIHIIMGLSPYLSQEWIRENEQYSKTVHGVDPLPTWRTCQKSVPCWMVAQRSIMRMRGTTRRSVVSETLQEVQLAFAEMLPARNWIDDETRGRALEKLDAMLHEESFPSWLLEDPENRLGQYFGSPKDVADDLGYLGKLLHLRKQRRNYGLSQIGKPRDPGYWPDCPQEVNAYYSPLDNKITVLGALIDEPAAFLWDHNTTRNEVIVKMAMSFGGIGGILAHELTHAFDDSGRAFDGNGRLLNWWSDKSLDMFKQAAVCISTQYGEYSLNVPTADVDGGRTSEKLYINGKLTLGENIADCGAVQIAWRALQRKLTMEELKSKPLLGYGISLTAEQLFLTSWGHMWCTRTQPMFLKNIMQSDSHSPDQYRIIGPLSNFDGYAETFQCPANSVMNPQERCRVW